MKLITHLYAIIICSILSFGIMVLLVIGFPIAIIVEVITFIKEATSNDGFEHGVWLKQCRNSFVYIKNVYCLIINSPYED